MGYAGATGGMQVVCIWIVTRRGDYRFTQTLNCRSHLNLLGQSELDLHCRTSLPLASFSLPLASNKSKQILRPNFFTHFLLNPHWLSVELWVLLIPEDVRWEGVLRSSIDWEGLAPATPAKQADGFGVRAHNTFAAMTLSEPEVLNFSLFLEGDLNFLPFSTENDFGTSTFWKRRLNICLGLVENQPSSSWNKTMALLVPSPQIPSTVL